MRTTAALVLAILSFGTFAQNLNRSINTRIDQLHPSQSNGEINRLSDGEKLIMNRGLTEALSVIRDIGRPPPRPTDNYPDNNGGSDWRRNSGFARNNVKVFSGDRCT